MGLDHTTPQGLILFISIINIIIALVAFTFSHIYESEDRRWIKLVMSLIFGWTLAYIVVATFTYLRREISISVTSMDIGIYGSVIAYACSQILLYGFFDKSKS
ncbi:hypothetical protein [Pseudalkalibacillus sp. SCS-8]|uniref:hypothetical protein n=1 Tax=Pseudalkalibacillus nanhaiensis TaxID=3115291 RepID=UPI0032DB0D9E